MLYRAVGTLALGLALCGVGCGKDTQKAEAKEEESEVDEPTSRTETNADADRSKPPGVGASPAVTEKVGDHEVSLAVTPDGDVSALVTKKGVKVDPAKVEGKLIARPLAGDTKPTEFVLEKRPGGLGAKIGKLPASVVELRYELKADGEPVNGLLLVPRGGTPALIENGDAVVKAKIKPGTKGPHGGLVQVVGDDIVEIAGRKGSGDVRVYVLDANLKPVKIGGRKIKLALAADRGELVDLTADDGGLYFHGTFAIKTNPAQVSVVIEDGDDIDACLVGYEPGISIVIGPAAPVFLIFVVDRWDVIVVEPIYQWETRPKFKGKGKGKHKHKHH